MSAGVIEIKLPCGGLLLIENGEPVALMDYDPNKQYPESKIVDHDVLCAEAELYAGGGLVVGPWEGGDARVRRAEHVGPRLVSPWAILSAWGEIAKRCQATPR